jgi:homoserine dehydrogenase
MHQEGAEFEEVLKEAQDLGYAEADPSSDVDGHDVAYKLAILGSIAFDCHLNIDDVFREGIRKVSFRDIEVAKQYGYVIKLLAIGILRSADEVELRVHPVMLEKSHPLAAVSESFNAVYVEGENVGETMFYGRGAGELPTASAIVGDIVAIARATDIVGTTPCLSFGNSRKRVVPMGKVESKYFIRLVVKDSYGVLAAISRVFGDHQVSLTTVQQAASDGETAELVIMTHIVKESQIQQAVKQLADLDVVFEVASLIRAGL